MLSDIYPNKREGSSSPGDFRYNLNHLITGSSHQPPDYTQVQSYMDGFIAAYIWAFK